MGEAVGSNPTGTTRKIDVSIDTCVRICYSLSMSSAPTKAAYYGEDYSSMTTEEKMELFGLESREAAGILWSAFWHAGGYGTPAGDLLVRLHDELIDDEIEGRKTKNNFKAAGMSLSLYRFQTAGCQPVTLGNGQIVDWFPAPSKS